MNEQKKIMQMVTGIYFVAVAIGLFLLSKIIPAQTLLHLVLPLALVLLLVWFLLIFAVLKHQTKQKQKEEEVRK